MIRPRIFILCAAFLFCFAQPAKAHLVTTGMGPVYDGILHFAVSPEDLFPVLALALFAGLRGKEQSRRVLVILPAAWLLGGICALIFGPVAMPAITWAPLILLGGLVAANAPLPIPATMVLAIIFGLFGGFLNGMAMAQPGLGTSAIVGTTSVVFVVVALAATFVATTQSNIIRLGARVIGSWIAASGMLLLGWSLRAGIGTA